MTKLELTRTLLVILLCSFATAQSGPNHNVNNWFTKSIDYFHYENCSSQERSDLNAKFFSCLNSPPKDDKDGYSQYYQDYLGYMGGMSGGADSLNPSVPNYINKFNPQAKFSSGGASKTPNQGGGSMGGFDFKSMGGFGGSGSGSSNKNGAGDFQNMQSKFQSDVQSKSDSWPYKTCE